MKFKYFLRGLGFGIVFSAIICLTAYQGNAKKEMTDEEIIRRAKALGMVEQEDQVGKLLGIDQQKEKSEDESSKTESQNKTEAGKSEQDSETKEKISEDASSADNETKEKNQTSKQEDKKTESSTEKEDKTTEKKEQTVKLTIKRGDSSFPVCEKLQELGLIEDAAEFDTYLVENGYASRIRVGEHSLKKGMSFHDIAEAISDPL